MQNLLRTPNDRRVKISHPSSFVAIHAITISSTSAGPEQTPQLRAQN